jgi:Domain of unknown function (DUF6881)
MAHDMRHDRSYRSCVPSHFVAHWNHIAPDDPIRLYEELADDRTELRKVEEFRDGRLIRADSVTDATTSLSSELIPDLTEIGRQPEFTVELLSADDFEAVWARAVDATP